MNYKNTSLVAALVLLLLPVISFAAFVPLVGIPQLGGATDLGSYINALYAVSISIAALLAVVKIIIAGVKWMLSDVVTSKQEAKSDMQGALLGLLIVISAVLVLGQINPQLVATDLVLTPVAKAPSNGTGPGGSAVAPMPFISLTPGSPILPPTGSQISLATKTPCAADTCIPESAVCTESGGKPTVKDNFMSKNDSLCAYGKQQKVSCKQRLDLQTGRQKIDCTDEIAACQAKKGTFYPDSANSATCVYPN